jgi:hypothetical protein
LSPPHTSDLLVLLDLLVYLVVKVELVVLTALPVVTEKVVTMPTERRTKLPLESSDQDLEVLEEVLLEQSKAYEAYHDQHSKIIKAKSRATNYTSKASGWLPLVVLARRSSSMCFFISSISTLSTMYH